MANPPLPAPTQAQIQQQIHANQQLDSQHNLEDSDDSEEPTMTPTPDAVNAVAHQLEELIHTQKPAAEDSAPAPAQHSRQQRQKPKPSKPKLKDLAVNLSDLAAAAENLGLERPKGKGQGYQALLHQLLHTLASAESDFSAPLHSTDSPVAGEELTQAIQTLTQEMSNLRQQLAVITTQLHSTQQQLSQAQHEQESRRLLAAEVEALRGQLEQTQNDRSSLQAQLDQLLPLQAERDLLKTELKKAQDLLGQFRLLSMGAAAIQPD
ncbi:hypothetical protein, partial [Leptolyngbya sp. FACHB-711]|uniref:hypothetical protein n=1 Tax=Leptolyngbya sp. FACHB-711 TaxID=2692813 RepID=UPI001689CA82